MHPIVAARALRIKNVTSPGDGPGNHQDVKPGMAYATRNVSPALGLAENS
jgi:hypothetical protein